MMQIPNGQGNMMPLPPKPQGVGMQGPSIPQAPGLQGQAVDRGRLDQLGQTFRSQFEGVNNATAEVGRLQGLVDRMMRNIGQAQATGARPSQLAMMQSQLDVLMRQLNEAKQGEDRMKQQRLLEQQMRRARAEGSTASPVGGRDGRAPYQRAIGNLEDQMLATMLGIGGIRTMR